MSEDLERGARHALVELAQEPAFTLAHVIVTPAALRLQSGRWSLRLEPRAMQVLVTLARASPAVVARNELNARAWGGRIVGEDAMNRAIQKVRRAAQAAPPPLPFWVETIPRVGYRLAVGGPAVDPGPGTTNDEYLAGDPAATHEPAQLTPARRRGTRRLMIAVAVLALPVAALSGWLLTRPRAAEAGGWSIAHSRTLDDLPPGASDAMLSPDGRSIAYRGTDAARHERIFVRAALDGGLGRPVSDVAMNTRRPVWSPDGAALAFATYRSDRPCRLFVMRLDAAARRAGDCETVREPRLAWSANGGALLFGDAPGENAVQRISGVLLADGTRIVLSSPPGDSMGDGAPLTRGGTLVFQRQFGWADEGWIRRDLPSGRDRLLWRRTDVTGSVAAILDDGSLAVAWTRSGLSRLDFVDPAGRLRSQPIALGPVSGLSAAGSRLLIETDRSESALVRVPTAAPAGTRLAPIRGRMSGPVLLGDGRLRVPVSAAGTARVWEYDRSGVPRPWGGFTATRLAGLAVSPDGRFTSALATGRNGREIVVLDQDGAPVYRWRPRARSLNPGAWSGDGRSLVVPMLDGAGWRLFRLDPFARGPATDIELPGFAVVRSFGAALYAARAGETTGIRELWRLDGTARRLPIDLSLFDIVNWYPVAAGVWLPDRRLPDRPRLVLRDAETGRPLRAVDAPGLAGASAGLTADAQAVAYVTTYDAREYRLLTLARADRGR